MSTSQLQAAARAEDTWASAAKRKLVIQACGEDGCVWVWSPNRLGSSAPFFHARGLCPGRRANYGTRPLGVLHSQARDGCEMLLVEAVFPGMIEPAESDDGLEEH